MEYKYIEQKYQNKRYAEEYWQFFYYQRWAPSISEINKI